MHLAGSAKRDYFSNLSLDDILLDIRLLNKIITFIFEVK